VEYALGRLLEREINRLKYVDKVRSELTMLPHFSPQKLFAMLDIYDLGFLSEN
jgi:hypothetical protein